MKQANIGALMRMTVLAALLGSASYAQDLTDAATDETNVEQSTVEENASDETTSADEGSDESSDAGTEDGSDLAEDDDSAGEDGYTEDEDDLIVIDDGDIIEILPIDDGGMIVVDTIEYCDEAGCYVVSVCEDYPVLIEEGDDWIKREDETTVGDGTGLECLDGVCPVVDVPVTDIPEILYTTTGIGSVDDGHGHVIDVPVLVANPEILANTAAGPLQQLQGEASGSAHDRSASADGRVLCLSVPKAARNGRAAFDLCEP